jgi:hypothetical protein
MRTIVLPAVMAALVLVAATACGGSASANGSSGAAAVSSHGGTTTVTGSGGGHSFQAQITSLAALLDRASRMSGSGGGGHLATAIAGVRKGLGTARAKLASTTFPSVIASQKRQLLRALGGWDGDLARAQQTARSGDTGQALDQARSSTFSDLKALVDTLTAASSL